MLLKRKWRFNCSKLVLFQIELRFAILSAEAYYFVCTLHSNGSGMIIKTITKNFHPFFRKIHHSLYRTTPKDFNKTARIKAKP